MHDAHCMLHAKVELISEPSGKIFCVDGGVGAVDMKDMKCQSDP